MTVVYVPDAAAVEDSARRKAVFQGNFFVYDARPTTTRFCDDARDTLEELLGESPPLAQQRMAPAEFASKFRAAGRALTQRPATLELVQAVVTDLGCDLSDTYVTYPVLTASTGEGFIGHGLSQPQHPHRDTWYAAPVCQINWWMPLFDAEEASSLAFLPGYWESAVRNTSDQFDFMDWRTSELIGDPTKPVYALNQPRPLDAIALRPDIRISCPASSLVLFSSAQLYSVVPNDSLRTYFGVHFKTVSRKDLAVGAGPSNLDARPSGTALSEFMSGRDFRPLVDR